MKKLLSQLICLVMVVGVMLTAFVGCDWITTNTERDMNQVIATVKINDDIDEDQILKRQLVSGFYSYGYQYVYYYGYTSAKAYEVVLDNLINSRIIIQQSRVELAKTYNAIRNENDDQLTDFQKYWKNNALADKAELNAKSGSVENITKFLTAYEVAEAYYNVRKGANDMIDSYKDEEEEEDAKEDVTYTARTTPTEEAEEDLTEEELKAKEPTEHEYQVAALTLGEEAVAAMKQDPEKNNVYALNMAVWGAYKIKVSTVAEKKAYGSMLQYLKDQGLINKSESYDYAEDTDKILEYTYFKDNIKSQLESKLVSKYEESLVSGVQAKLTDDAIWEQYKIDYENQEALYKNDVSAYETALDGATDSKPVLYNPFGGYGYVANLLIGFTDEQKTQLSDYSAKKGVSAEQIVAFRKSLAEQLVAKDQRSTWAFLNYGTFADGTFTFEDKYTVSDLEKYKNFLGTVEVKDAAGYEEKDDDGVTSTKWQVTKATATPVKFADFITDDLALAGIEDKRFEDGEFGKIENFGEADLNKIKELIYVYSTDPGSLSSEYGYLYSPYTSASKYVKEFAAAAKLVVENGVGAYTLVITDYGVHVIVCTKLVEEAYAVNDTAEAKAAFIAALADKTSAAYKYKKVKLDTVTNDEVSRIANNFIKEYSESKVTRYEKTYEDLVTESSAE